jgi:hypothetical protein
MAMNLNDYQTSCISHFSAAEESARLQRTREQHMMQAIQNHMAYANAHLFTPTGPTITIQRTTMPSVAMVKTQTGWVMEGTGYDRGIPPRRLLLLCPQP